MKNLILLFALVVSMFSNAQAGALEGYVTYFEINDVNYIHLIANDRYSSSDVSRDDYCYPDNAVDRDLYIETHGQASGGRQVLHVEVPATISVSINGQQFSVRQFTPFEIQSDLSGMLIDGTNAIYRVDGDQYVLQNDLSLIECPLDVDGTLECADIRYGLNEIRVGDHSFISTGSKQGNRKVYRLGLLNNRLIYSSVPDRPSIEVLLTDDETIIGFNVNNNGVPVGFIPVDSSNSASEILCSSAFRTLIQAALAPHIEAQVPFSESGWSTDDAAFPATYTHADYSGASYIITRGTGNRSYIVSDIINTDGSQLTAYGHTTATGNVTDYRNTVYFHSIIDAHAAARTAIANNN